MEDPVQAGPVEDVAVGEKRVVAGGEHDEAADEEGEEDRRHRHRDAACALAEREPSREGSARLALLGRQERKRRRLGHAAGTSGFTPTISKPICSSETAPSCLPTISPS